jgi:hypothetical protein
MKLTADRSRTCQRCSVAVCSQCLLWGDHRVSRRWVETQRKESVRGAASCGPPLWEVREQTMAGEGSVCS